MELANVSLRLLACSQLILFILLIVCSANSLKIRVVGTLLLLGVGAYLVMPLAETYTAYAHQLSFFWFLAAISPGLLLVFVWLIFEENSRVPLWMKALVTCSVLASFWYQISAQGLPDSPLWLQVLKVFISCLVVFVVWRGRDSDLVELRSKIRAVFILAFALMMIVVLAVEVYTSFAPALGFDTLTVLVIFIYSVTLNYFFAKMNPSAKLTSPPVPVNKASDDPLIKELLQRMQDERLYADHDVRVASLASLFNVPEYILRNKINQQLGYRNFNQFVNHYRVEEAGIKLREEPRTPVLSIALDVGFRSISSFNSAFQAQFGVSPTRYRAEALRE